MTATSADGSARKWRFIAAVGPGGGLGGAAEGVAGKVDGVALETWPEVGVRAGGDANVGVAQKFLDHDEVDALLQEQGGGGVSEVVEADASEPHPVDVAAEAAGEVGWVERSAIGLRGRPTCGPGSPVGMSRTCRRPNRAR